MGFHFETVQQRGRQVPLPCVGGNRVTVATLIETEMELDVNKLVVAALGAFLVAACGRDVEESYLDQDVASEGLGEVFDEDAARELAEEEVAADGYSGPCTFDCSGHDAGFEWAAEGNPDGGISSSPSFDEGQQAFEEAVEERIDEYREEFEAEQ